MFLVAFLVVRSDFFLLFVFSDVESNTGRCSCIARRAACRCTGSRFDSASLTRRPASGAAIQSDRYARGVGAAAGIGAWLLAPHTRACHVVPAATIRRRGRVTNPSRARVDTARGAVD
jgi:hypothetical protein